MLTILFDGIAYGMVLFVLACGLVTLGLMNFVNLAHGAFAMAGGYITAVLMNRYGVPFLATLPLAFIGPALIGLLLERTLYRRLYGRNHLDQVLFSIGLVFMAVAAVDYHGVAAAAHPASALASGPGGGARHPGRALSKLHHRGLRRPRRRPAADPDEDAVRQPSPGSGRRPRVARGLGINVGVIFATTFAVGSGLAGLGGALGAEILGLDPTFPLKFMIYFLIVVTVGGTTSITGPFLASLLLGIADVAGILRSEPGRVRHLHAHDRRAGSSAAGPFRSRPVR